jgi:4-amino-4-deoxy-L-arabinose transferase-like glycosyltransferase
VEVNETKGAQCISGPEEPGRSPGRGSRAGLWLLLVLLTLLAFGVRVAVNELRGGLGQPYIGDEGDYVSVARNVLAGHGYVGPHGPTSMRTPGLPFLMGTVMALWGEKIALLRLTMALVNALIVPAIYLLGRELMGVRAGLLAALVAVAFPAWAYDGAMIYTDLPTSALACVLAYLVIRAWKRDSLWLAAAAGLLAGGLSLVRPTGVAFVGAAVLWLLLCMRNWRRRLGASLVLVGAFGLVIAPWCVRNYYAHGRFVFLSARTGSDLWHSNNPYAIGIAGLDLDNYEDPRVFFAPATLPEAEDDRIYKAAAFKFMKEHPRRVAELMGIKFIQFWKVWSPRVSLAPNVVMLLSFGPVLVCFLIAAGREGWRRGPALLLVLMIGALTALHMVFIANVRYRLAIEPLCVVLALYGVLPYWDRFKAATALRREGATDAK